MRQRVLKPRVLRGWTALDIVLLVISVLVVLLGIVFAVRGQPVPPPVPGGSLTNVVRIAWDRNPDLDYYHAVDTNGVAVPLVYRLRQSTTLTNPLPWPVVVETTNTVALVSNLTAQTHFWYVTASNFFLESEPSRVLSLPFVRPANLRIEIP